VDRSLFEHNGTTIPEWACRMWGLQQMYSGVTSRKDSRSKAFVTYGGLKYNAWVTTAPHRRKSPAVRMWYGRLLSLELKRTFLMSYMRSLEGALHKLSDVEQSIPFWEFLDIEFDGAQRVFRFVAYYKQQPSFPHLFERLIGSPALRKVADEIERKADTRIYKQDWKPRSDLEFELGAQNVIYMVMYITINISTLEKSQILLRGSRNLIRRYPIGTIFDTAFFRHNSPHIVLLWNGCSSETLQQFSKTRDRSYGVRSVTVS
jgi:hypothetical protein